MSLPPLVAGNWKMNGLTASLTEIEAVRAAVAAGKAGRAQVVVCPPATLLAGAAAIAKDTALCVGAQDCHAEPSGARTGELSAEMLADAGATHVIIGHSERRADHGETDAIACAKASAAIRAGLVAIVCVGETRAEREAGHTLQVIGSQVDGSTPPQADARTLVVAYEPVWAIGTGLTPTIGDVAEVHAFLRARLAGLLPDGGAVRLLYGGSVKPSNAAQLMAVPAVDGALVGGASLKATDLMAIAAAYA